MTGVTGGRGRRSGTAVGDGGSDSALVTVGALIAERYLADSVARTRGRTAGGPGQHHDHDIITLATTARASLSFLRARGLDTRGARTA